MGKSRGIVAAGHRLTARTAADILRAGGNAMDAAIAALAMACVCEPVLASPGGGGFAMIRGADGKKSLLDFFPHTPLERRQTDNDGVYEIIADFGTATQAFHIGPATSATPGFLPGLLAMHNKGATMAMDDLLGPARAAAVAGTKVTSFQYYLSTVVGLILTATPQAAALFAPEGRLLEAGETFRNPGLAAAFEEFGRDRAGSNISRSIIASQREHGHLTEADLDAYKVWDRDPLELSFEDARISLNPLPAAGGVMVAHSLNSLASDDPLATALALHATGVARSEAGGDMAVLARLPLRRRGTTHLSIIDSERNACAVTVSNGEGNGSLVGEYGFMLNNVLGEEDVNPGLASGWPENQRLASMMCPVIVETSDGSLIALGSGGSNRIRSAIYQTLVRLCRNRENVEAAVRAPRFHLEGDHLDFEDQFDDRFRELLVNAFPVNRAWRQPNMFFGGVHAVKIDADGKFSGCGDARRDGHCQIAD